MKPTPPLSESRSDPPHPTPDRSGRLRVTFAAALGGAVLVVLMGFLFVSTILASPAVILKITPEKVSVPPGGTADFTFEITNSGSVTLTEIAVDSRFMGSCNRPYYGPPFTSLNLPDLGPGQSTSYTCSHGGYTQNAARSAAVEAIPEGGGDIVTASDEVQFIVEHLLISATDLVQIGSGQMASLTVVVSNTGNFKLTQIEVTSTVAPDCVRSLGSLSDLDPGQSHTYSCQTLPLFVDLEGQIDGSAQLTDTTPLEDKDQFYVQILTPLEITQTPDRQLLTTGQYGTIEVTLKNNGTETITDVTVDTTQTPNCSRAAGTVPDLGPGATFNYSCITPPLDQDLISTLTAAGQENGVTVKAVSSAFVGADPPVKIDISPEIQFTEPGLTATFMVTVTNTMNNLSVISVTVDAPETPGCVKSSGEIPDLSPGGSYSYSCDSVIQTSRYYHPMTVQARPYDGDPVSDQDQVYAGQRQLYMPWIVLDTKN